MQSVTGLHTLLSSPPLRFPCWLQLCKRTEIVFLFFPSAKVALELVFCLKNNEKNPTDMMFSVLHSADFYLWIEYGTAKMIKRGSCKHMLLLSPFNSFFPNCSKNHYQDCLVRKSSAIIANQNGILKKCITALFINICTICCHFNFCLRGCIVWVVKSKKKTCCPQMCYCLQMQQSTAAASVFLHRLHSWHSQGYTRDFTH